MCRSKQQLKPPPKKIKNIVGIQHCRNWGDVNTQGSRVYILRGLVIATPYDDTISNPSWIVFSYCDATQQLSILQGEVVDKSTSQVLGVSCCWWHLQKMHALMVCGTQSNFILMLFRMGRQSSWFRPLPGMPFSWVEPEPEMSVMWSFLRPTHLVHVSHWTMMGEQAKSMMEGMNHWKSRVAEVTNIKHIPLDFCQKNNAHKKQNEQSRFTNHVFVWDSKLKSVFRCRKKSWDFFLRYCWWKTSG